VDNLSVIDRFLDVFFRYIDSGFGLLHGEIAFLTATLVVIDMTLAGLWWAMGEADDVILKLLKKTLYVGAFAFILTNFKNLSSIVFHSFAGLGLTATGAGLTEGQLLQPGRLAAVGVQTARPMLIQIGQLSGPVNVFLNLDKIVVLGLSWLIVIISFFVLAVQMFVTLIEFKLTTLAGFVLLPFALWNKTAFLAERVLGNVVSSGVKVLVLAIIVGIGTNLFGQFTAQAGGDPTLDNALVLMLASLSLLGLGIFGPGIATGLISGAPQLGAGAAVGSAMAAAGVVMASGAAAMKGGRMAVSGVRAGTSLAGGARAVFAEGVANSGASGAASVGAGLANVASTAGEGIARKAKALYQRTTQAGAAEAEAADRPASNDAAPGWAKDLQRRQKITQGVSTAVQTVRHSDHGGAGASPSLTDEEK